LAERETEERSVPPALSAMAAWSWRYYNGYIYASDFNRGFDVIKINDRRTDPAARVRVDRLNAQTQGSYRDRGHDDWIWSEED
ncbi:hypothetical protein AB0B89_25665, partial [Sphaerisporangium sp. NPDC049002]